MKALDPQSPYFIDFPGRVRALQAEMGRAGIDVYLGSRLRTLSWLLDTFCPWRSFVVVPAEGPAGRLHLRHRRRPRRRRDLAPRRPSLRFRAHGRPGPDRAHRRLRQGPAQGTDGPRRHRERDVELSARGQPDPLRVRALPRRPRAVGARERPRPRRPAFARQGRGHDRPFPRGLAHRRRRARSRLRGPARRRLEGADRDRDRGLGGPGHAPGRERVGVVLHRRQRDRLGLPDRPHGRGLHAGFAPRAPGRRAAHGRHPRHVHAGPGRPLPQLPHRPGERPPALARPQLHRHRGPDARDLPGRYQPLGPGREDDRLRREPRLRRLHGPRLRARHRPDGRRMADRDERRSLPLLDQSRPPLPGERALNLRHAVRLPRREYRVPLREPDRHPRRPVRGAVQVPPRRRRHLLGRDRFRLLRNSGYRKA
ncbi:MAG: hypothetical protein MZU95_06655 [Desulfomicrobium escambiense]|nr:hypothetical protein [Desulfomicrobium escambiense]